jgi:hypothetical protein
MVNNSLNLLTMDFIPWETINTFIQILEKNGEKTGRG